VVSLPNHQPGRSEVCFQSLKSNLVAAPPCCVRMEGQRCRGLSLTIRLSFKNRFNLSWNLRRRAFAGVKALLATIKPRTAARLTRNPQCASRANTAKAIGTEKQIRSLHRLSLSFSINSQCPLWLFSAFSVLNSESAT